MVTNKGLLERSVQLHVAHTFRPFVPDVALSTSLHARFFIDDPSGPLVPRSPLEEPNISTSNDKKLNLPAGVLSFKVSAPQSTWSFRLWLGSLW